MNNHLKRMLTAIRMPARDVETSQISRESSSLEVGVWRNQCELSKANLASLAMGVKITSPEFLRCRTKKARKEGRNGDALQSAWGRG